MIQTNNQPTDDLFGFIEVEIEEPKQEVFACKPDVKLPEFIVAYQVRDSKDKKGFDHIIDTFHSDLSKGIYPIIPAEKKANAMKSIFPKNDYFVFAIGHDKKEVLCYTAKKR